MSREWNGSDVMREYARIASEQGLVSEGLLLPEKDERRPVGNPTETPAVPTRNKASKQQYGIKPDGTQEDLVEKAHPGDARPADAMGDGGLVENISQQQRTDIDIATKMPKGMLVGRHAALVNSLAKLANALDEQGASEAADRVDETMRRIARPFGKASGRRL